MIDVTPSPYEGAAPDPTKPQLPAPTSRTVDPGRGFGPWRIDDGDNTSWMK